MTSIPPRSALPGRRERNKQQKLDRITAAASELFAQHGVDEVTTQQIADAADIGTGTLFLYARSKAELLLLVQNTHYSEAIDTGRTAAAAAEEPLAAIMAMIQPVLTCNRAQVENGRSYLRELVFGDAEEPHHSAGLSLIADVDGVFAEILSRDGRLPPTEAALLARVISATMFISLASPLHVRSTDDEVFSDIRDQVRAILNR